MRYDVPSKSERDDGGNNDIGYFGFFFGCVVFVIFTIVVVKAFLGY